MSIFRSKTRGFEGDLLPFGIYCLCRLFFLLYYLRKGCGL